MAISRNFVFTDPVAGQQHVALAQLAASEKEANNRNIAALLESQSRERQQRGLTQSQMAQRDREFKTDAEIRRERIGVDRENQALYREADIANQKLNADKTRDAASKERAKVQFSSVIQALQDSVDDPPTASELETLLTQAPDLTEDQRQAARTVRTGQVKNAKANAAMGQRTAQNYTAELGVKGLLDEAKAKIYERMAKDRNILFDRATGVVESAFRMPREDTAPGQANILGATRPGGVFPSAQEMQALATSPAAFAAGPKVTTLDEIRAQVGSSSLGSPSPQMPAPAPSVNAFGIPTLSAMVKSIPISPYGGLAFPSRSAPAPALRVADLAPPPSPPQPGPMFTVPPEFMPPSGGADPADNRLFQILSKMPEFAALPPAGKQMVLDQVTGGLMAMPEPTPPRVSDFQTLRPEFVPQDPGYYVAPQ